MMGPTTCLNVPSQTTLAWTGLSMLRRKVSTWVRGRGAVTVGARLLCIGSKLAYSRAGVLKEAWYPFAEFFTSEKPYQAQT